MEFIILGVLGLIMIIKLLFYYKSIRKDKSVVEDKPIYVDKQLSEIYLAGGCFWGVQKYFDGIDGVLDTQVGYANGDGSIPSYESVCEGTTNYAETLRIAYDSSKVTLSYLLELYYEIIDPISINKQGHDIGTQYRTGIYYVNKDDKIFIENSLSNLQKKYDVKLAIEVQSLKDFFPAEAYHQDYLKKHPNGYCHIPSHKFKNK